MLYYVLYDILSMKTDLNHEATVESHVDTSGRHQSPGNETIALLHRCCALYFADQVFCNISEYSLLSLATTNTAFFMK